VRPRLVGFQLRGPVRPGSILDPMSAPTVQSELHGGQETVRFAAGKGRCVLDRKVLDHRVDRSWGGPERYCRQTAAALQRALADHDRLDARVRDQHHFAHQRPGPQDQCLAGHCEGVPPPGQRVQEA
jgi:hypothetical protein